MDLRKNGMEVHTWEGLEEEKGRKMIYLYFNLKKIKIKFRKLSHTAQDTEEVWISVLP